LLLRGIRAEPYAAAKDYQLVLNKDLRKRGKLVETPALEDQKPEDPKPLHGIIIAGPERAAAKPRPSRPSAPGPRRGKGGGGSAGPSGVGGDVPPVMDFPQEAGPGAPPSPAPVDPPPPDDPSGATLSGADPIIGGAPAPAPKPERQNLGRDWKDGLFGSKVQYKEYPAPGGKRVYRNYIIKCTNPDHPPGCHKTKGRYPAAMNNHGEVEPLAWLTAWLDTPIGPKGKHNLTDPAEEDVDAIVNSNLAELEDLFHSLVG